MRIRCSLHLVHSAAWTRNDNGILLKHPTAPLTTNEQQSHQQEHDCFHFFSRQYFTQASRRSIELPISFSTSPKPTSAQMLMITSAITNGVPRRLSTTCLATSVGTFTLACPPASSLAPRHAPAAPSA